MFSEIDFKWWCQSLNLSDRAQTLIRTIRSSEPERRVRSAAGNVSGFYPSRKMGRTIQFESHRNELAAVLEMEHDPDVIEFYDQPKSIKLNYQSKSGRALGVIHTPDYFVIRTTSAAWIECKMQEQLLKLAEDQPHRFRFDPGANVWRCPPGENYAAQFGLYYIVKSSADIDWVYQRNVLFLEDYLRTEALEINSEAVEYLRSLVAMQPGVWLSELLIEANQRSITSDCVYIAVVTGQLYTDLTAAALAQPERVRVYCDQTTAGLYQNSGRHGVSPLLPTAAKLSEGSFLTWDGKTWEIINQGDSSTWLKDDSGSVISLSAQVLSALFAQGSAQLAATARGTPLTDGQPAKELLAAASPADLTVANHRYTLLSAYRAAGWNRELGVSRRTLQRWEASARRAESHYRCGFVGLLPNRRLSGNRAHKLPEEALKLMEEHIAREYESLRQPTRFAVWAKLHRECEERGILPPSYQIFCRYVNRRSSHQQISKRQGRRAAYQLEEFYYELNQQTPRHGDRPFEIAHLDHTELDLEVVNSLSGRNLGRPWATFLSDGFSRRVLAATLTFDEPSYRSCMMTLRECVRRHARLPQILVVDGGPEFSSTYFETLLAWYEVMKKQRPGGKGRFGSACERLFGTTNTRFVYNLVGNTQMTKGNLRMMTKEVDPKVHATWTLEQLFKRLCEWAYEVYDTIEHPALGQSPQEAWAQGLFNSGQRAHQHIPYDDNFQMLTLPTTARGTAMVTPGRGIKINYIYYWSNAFRDPTIERRQVPVRYDPYDAGVAYAFVGKGWVRALSEFYTTFQGRSEKEIRLATEELRQRYRLHSRQSEITARKLADFLISLEAEESLGAQRSRDREMRSVLAVVEGNIPNRDHHLSSLDEPKENGEGEETIILRLASPLAEEIDLDSYEEY